MKIKKAFTLAEILIVLIVIGAIAALTLPNLMKGVTSAQFKSAYQKAFTTISSIASMEKVAGQLPSNSSADSMVNFFAALNQSLSVKEFSILPAEGDDSFALLKAGETYTSINYGGSKFGGGDKIYDTKIAAAVGTFSPWIITDDNVAYAIKAVSGGTCASKAALNSADPDKIINKTCLLIIVDTNGLAKGPNALETQLLSLTKETKLGDLTGDRYYIYLGNDGVAAGSKEYSATARIMGDMK